MTSACCISIPATSGDEAFKPTRKLLLCIFGSSPSNPILYRWQTWDPGWPITVFYLPVLRDWFRGHVTQTGQIGNFPKTFYVITGREKKKSELVVNMEIWRFGQLFFLTQLCKPINSLFKQVWVRFLALVTEWLSNSLWLRVKILKCPEVSMWCLTHMHTLSITSANSSLPRLLHDGLHYPNHASVQCFSP